MADPTAAPVEAKTAPAPVIRVVQNGHATTVTGPGFKTLDFHGGAAAAIATDIARKAKSRDVTAIVAKGCGSSLLAALRSHGLSVEVEQ